MSATKTVPTLLHLVHRRFAVWLCVEQIKLTPLPANSLDFGPAYFESCETKIVEMLHETYALDLPKTCLDAVCRCVHVLVEDMKQDLCDLNLVTLMGYIAKTKKWHDLAASWWSTCWQQAGETAFLTVFEAILRRSEKEGLCVVPEDDLATYLDVWQAAPKDLKINVFRNLLRVRTRKRRYAQSILEPYSRPRNLEFVTILFAEFDLETRLALWEQHWLDSMAGISLTHLEALMRLCTNSERSFEQFKAAWLSTPDIIERYYCALIGEFQFHKLNELLRFYSSDDGKVLDLAVLTIRTYFITNPLPKSYEHLHRISMSNGWLKKAVETAELQYLWRTDEEKLRTHCCQLIVKGEYNQLTDFLRLFAPEEEVRTLEKRYVEFLLLENSDPYAGFRRGDWFSSQQFKKLPKFDAFIKRVFDSADEATDFKKRLLYASCTLAGLRNGFPKIDEFVRLCLPSDREITEWEDTFMRYIIRCMRKRLTGSHSLGWYRHLIRWCVSSQEKFAKFKSIVSIDDLFEIFVQSCRTETDAFWHFFALNEALIKWYPHVEDRIEFKLQKLRDHPTNEVVLGLLLGVDVDEFLQQNTEEQKRQVVAKAFAVNLVLV